MGKIVNKAELSVTFDISERTLTEWQDAGMPVLRRGERGESNQYDVPVCIRWWMARELAKVQGETPRDRLARVQADRVEMDMAKDRGELVPFAAIGQEWASMVLAARQALLTVAQDVAPLCVGLDDQDPIREIVQDAIEDALTRLSHDSAGELAASDDGALGAAASPVAVAVGGDES